MEDKELSAILRSFRHYVTRRGGFSKTNLEKVFQEIDCVCDDDMLVTEELLRRMTAIGIEMTSQEAAMVKRHFDGDNSGTVSLDEFFRAMQPPLTKTRARLVKRGFLSVKDDVKGEAPTQLVKERCKIQYHPDVESKKVAANDQMTQMLHEMGGSDGWISEADFETFAKTLSYLYANDDDFGLCFSRMWSISFIPSHSIKKCQKFIKRSVCMTENISDEDAASRIRETFVKFDGNQSGSLEFDEFQQFMEALSINLGELELKAIFEFYDSDGSGSVELGEFIKGIISVKPFSTQKDALTPEPTVVKSKPQHARRGSSAEAVLADGTSKRSGSRSDMRKSHSRSKSEMGRVDDLERPASPIQMSKHRSSRHSRSKSEMPQSSKIPDSHRKSHRRSRSKEAVRK